MVWAIRHIVFLGLCFGCIFQAETALAQDRVASGRAAGGSSPTMLPAALSNSAFIPNRGQLADQFGKPMPEVLYTSSEQGAKCYFTKNSMHYVFSKNTKTPPLTKERGRGEVDRDTLSLYRVDLHFLGANPEVTITAEDTASDYTNYYLAQCPNGITRVPAFHKIIYHDLYPHIDMVVYSRDKTTPYPLLEKEGESEYDFIVHPGGDPKQIQVRYDGQDSLVLNGNLRVVSPFGEVTELAPSSFQGERSVSSHYILRSNILSYKIGAYDHTRDLTIDPQRLWGTYFAGSGSDSNTFLQDLAVDRGGNIDVAGYTNSANIATTGAFQTTFAGGFYDGLIARFGPDGSLRWATYYGGNQTTGPPAFDGDDDFQAIACDNTLGMVAAGATGSGSGIASPGAFQTTPGGTMLASFDSNGVRRWATYYGGQGTGVAIDSAGNIILIGATKSATGIATPGAYQTALTPGIGPPGFPPPITFDLFLAKFTSGGSRLWGTYFGGPGDENSGWVSADVNNNIYFTASTNSTSMIATANAFQPTPGPICFGKFSPTLSTLNWATYFLHSAKGLPGKIAVDRSANIFFTASDTESGIATAGAYQSTWGGHFDGILGKFNTNGNRVWASYYGGDSDDWLYCLALDTAANIFAGGLTWSPTRIASTGEYQTGLLGPWDPFLIKLDSSGKKRYWATYYGRRGWVNSVGIDRAGHPIVGGTTQVTGINTEFSSPGADETLPLGATNGFLAKFCDPTEVQITSSVSSGPICPNTRVTLTAPKGFASYLWSLNNTLIPGANGQTYSFLTPAAQGFYNYTVNVTGTDFCSAISDTIRLSVRQGPQAAVFPADSICPGSSIKFLASATGLGPLTYSWTPAATLDHPDSLQPTATPTKTTTYTFAAIDTNGCTATKQVTVYFYPVPNINMGGNRTDCSGAPLPLTATVSAGAPPFAYSWSPASTLDRTDSSTVIATPTAATKYFVTVTDAHGCSYRESVVVQLNPLPTISTGPPLSVCRGSSIKIGAKINGGKMPYVFAWSPAATLNDPTLAQPTASPLVTTLYRISATDKNGCVAIDSVLVTVADSLTPTVTATGPLTICTGDTVHLTAGTGYATYAWSSGDTTPDLAVTKSGNYSVHVTSGSCAGTSNIVQVTVLPDSVPRPVLTASSTTICSGDSIPIALTEHYSTYRWSTGDTTATIVVRQAGSYGVTVTNSAGCSGTSAPLAITVLLTPSVTISANGPTTFCSDDSLTLLATPGTGGSYAFRWSNGDSTPSIIVTSSGSYSVIIKNFAGCTASSTPVVVTVNPSPNPTMSGPSSACPNSTTTYSVANVSSDNYAWTLTPSGVGTIASPSSASTSIQWSVTGTVTLSLTETAPDGCSTTVERLISITSNLSPLVSGPSTMCQGDSITLDAGNGYATYQWSRDGAPIAGATNETLVVDQAGNYTVFVTSAGGCSGTSAPAMVTSYPLPAKPIITRNGAVLRSTPSAHYQWSFAGSLLTDSVNQTIVPNAYGLYTVTIADTNGCSNTSDPYQYSKGDTVPYASVSVPHGMLAAPGVTVSIPLTLDSSNGLAANGAANFVARIGMDPTMLTPVSPVGVLIGNRWVVSFAGLTPATSGVLQTITALAADSGFCSGLTIDTFYFTGASIPVTSHSGLVCLTAPCTPILHSSDTAFTIKRISPNPTEASFTIDYHIAAEGPVSMELDDYLGRNIQTLKDEWSNAGDKEETYSVAAVPSGIYRLVLRSASAQSGTRALSKMLMVTK